MIYKLDNFLSWNTKINDIKQQYRKKFGDAEWIRPFDNEILNKLEILTINEQESKTIKWIEEALEKISPKNIRNRVSMDYVERLIKTTTIPPIRNAAFRISISAAMAARPKNNSNSAPSMVLTDTLQFRPSYILLQAWGLKFRTEFIRAFSESSLERSGGIAALDRFTPYFDDLIKEFYTIVCDEISSNYNDAILSDRQSNSVIRVKPIDISCYSCRINLENRDFIVLHTPVKRSKMSVLGGNHVWPRKRSLGQKYPTLPFHSLCRHLYDDREVN